MIRKASYIVLAAVLIAPPLRAQGIDIELAAEYLAEARAIGAADGARLWGRRLDGPLVFVDARTRQAVASEPDSAGALRPRDGVFVGTLPAEVAVANTGFRWGGREWTMVMWPLPSSAVRRRTLLAHEMFHRVQREAGLPNADSPAPHLDGGEARRWLRLEWRALAQALLRTGAARRRAVEDALVFRARRRVADPSYAAVENALELNEGLAEYTGFRAGGLPADALPAAVALHLDEYDVVARRSAVVRSFAYASGPAYGVLLDLAGARWRPAIRPDADLGHLLARAYRVRLPPDVADAEARAAAYGGARVAREEAARDRDRAEKAARMRARYVDGPLLALLPEGSFGYTFDPTGVEALEGQGTVYPSARITADWGVLEVSGGVLMVRGAAGIERIVLPAPADPGARPLVGEGWKLDLAPGWRVVPATRPGDVRLERSPP